MDDQGKEAFNRIKGLYDDGNLGQAREEWDSFAQKLIAQKEWKLTQFFWGHAGFLDGHEAPTYQHLLQMLEEEGIIKWTSENDFYFVVPSELIRSSGRRARNWDEIQKYEALLLFYQYKYGKQSDILEDYSPELFRDTEDE